MSNENVKVNEGYVIDDVIEYLLEISAIRPSLDTSAETSAREKITALKMHTASSGTQNSIDYMKVAIDEAVERHLTSAEAIALSRLSHIDNITSIVRDNITYINIILHFGELMGLKLTQRKFISNEEMKEFIEYEVPVSTDTKVDYNQIIDIASKAQSRLKRLENELKTLRITSNNFKAKYEFEVGRYAALLNKNKELEKSIKNVQHDNIKDLYVIYSGERNRYMRFCHTEKGESVIRTTKKVTQDCIFTSKDTAIQAVYLATTNPLKKPIKNWHNYRLINLAKGNVQENAFQKIIDKVYK